MKITITLLFVCACLFSGCSNETPESDVVSSNDQPFAHNPSEHEEPGWPKDADGLVAHLNDWHKDELIAYNEPERFPNFVTSGETNGWISAHEEQLAKLRVEINWDSDNSKYVIVKSKQ